MSIFKGELNPADELRNAVSQKGEEDYVHNSERASDNAGLVYGTQGDASPSSLAQIDRKLKETKTCSDSLNNFRNVESAREHRQLLPEYPAADDPPEGAGHRAYCLRNLRRHQGIE